MAEFNRKYGGHIGFAAHAHWKGKGRGRAPAGTERGPGVENPSGATARGPGLGSCRVKLSPGLVKAKLGGQRVLRGALLPPSPSAEPGCSEEGTFPTHSQLVEAC